MSQKTVYQTDEEGYLVGTSIADESPEEAGRFLIPRLCYEDPPPAPVAGNRIRRVNHSWVYEEIPTPPSPEPDPPTFDELKAKKLAEINAECNRRIGAEVLSYPITEVLTFAKQEAEARAYLADASAPTPMIDALSENRGIGKDELISRIIAKADYFAEFTGKIIGYRQKLEDQLNAPGVDLDAIDPLVGWPA